MVCLPSTFSNWGQLLKLITLPNLGYLTLNIKIILYDLDFFNGPHSCEHADRGWVVLDVKLACLLSLSLRQPYIYVNFLYYLFFLFFFFVLLSFYFSYFVYFKILFCLDFLYESRPGFSWQWPYVFSVIPWTIWVMTHVRIRGLILYSVFNRFLRWLT